MALTIAQFQAMAGSPLGTSGWILIDQPRIDAFADVTLDHQEIHVDPDKARQSPFGGPIAHGFLTLSLLSRMAYDVLPEIKGTGAGLNYGFDAIRFLAPVPAGKRVRGHFDLLDVSARGATGLIAAYEATCEIEGGVKPAFVAKWMTLFVVDGQAETTNA